MGCLANEVAPIQVRIPSVVSQIEYITKEGHDTTITMVLMGTWLELWSVLLLILTLLTKEYI